jgi:hypothetical protein
MQLTRMRFLFDCIAFARAVGYALGLVNHRAINPDLVSANKYKDLRADCVVELSS